MTLRQKGGGLVLYMVTLLNRLQHTGVLTFLQASIQVKGVEKYLEWQFLGEGILNASVLNTGVMNLILILSCVMTRDCINILSI